MDEFPRPLLPRAIVATLHNLKGTTDPTFVPVGGKSPAMLGGTLWSAKEEVSQDERGLQSAKLLVAQVAQVALKLFKHE